MAEISQTPVGPEVLYCTVHPTVETTLRCNKCGRPMCIKCARRTPVGYRCKECVSNQQAIFYNSQPLDPLIQLVVSGLMSIVGAALIGEVLGMIGFGILTIIISIPASVFAGGLIADMSHRAVGKRHGRYGWLAVAAGIILGALVVGVVPMLFSALARFAAGSGPAIGRGGGTGTFLLFAAMNSIGWWVYVVAATATAIGRLRMGK